MSSTSSNNLMLPMIGCILLLVCCSSAIAGYLYIDIGSTSLSDCSDANPNWIGKSSSSWDDNDRNTGIWLVNHFNPSQSVPEISKLANNSIYNRVKKLCKV